MQIEIMQRSEVVKLLGESAGTGVAQREWCAGMCKGKRKLPHHSTDAHASVDASR
jgi:hypothetical protein